MNVDRTKHSKLANRERLVERLDHMVASGRLTEPEAERLRTASEPTDFDDAVRNVRVRHARVKLDAAVADGEITRKEADELLEQLRNGEHPRSLRARLRERRPST